MCISAGDTVPNLGHTFAWKTPTENQLHAHARIKDKNLDYGYIQKPLKSLEKLQFGFCSGVSCQQTPTLPLHLIRHSTFFFKTPGL